MMLNRNFSFDVVVAGGGTAGVAAALGAAMAGARVAVLERDPYLGGIATHSGVGAFCGFYTCGDNPVKVVSGAGDLVLEELKALNPHAAEIIISAAGNKNINFHPEYLKCALDTLMERYHVTLLLHTTITAVWTDAKRMTALVCHDDEGEFTVTADAFVDATGDAALSFMADLPVQIGDAQGAVQTATLPFRLCNVDPHRAYTPAAVEQAVQKGKAAGIPNMTREKGFILQRKGSTMVTVLLPMAEVKDLSAMSLTAQEINTRRQALAYTEAFRRYLPGMEHCELALIGPTLGFRESRRMIGRASLCAADVLERRKSPSGVARGGWKPEIHRSVNQMATYLDVKNKSYFDIPLDVLRSAALDNLFGAGRVVSSDAIAFAAVRVMGTCFATGQAAGAAAAFQAKKNACPVTEVQQELKRQGALV